MSPKRKQPELDWEPVFDKFFAAANASDDKRAIVKFLKAMKTQLEPTPAITHKQAKSFTLEDAVYHFSLTYAFEFPNAAHFDWAIEMLPDVKEIQPSACLSSFLHDYTTNYDRSSEAACRVAVDLIIAYCLAELKGRASMPSRTADVVQPLTTGPKPMENIKAFCEISFTHAINHTTKSEGVIVGGRVDHGIGIVVRRLTKPNRRFYSLLLCVEAKIKDTLATAYGQLVVYLASLRESRINRGKSDSSVYGVATDGLKYVFVTITHAGKLLFSRQFDVLGRDLPVVLGSLRYLLEKAIAISPNSSPKSELSQNDNNDADDTDEALDLDNSPYISAGDDESDTDDE